MEIQPTGQSAAFNCFSSDQKMWIEAIRMNNSSRPCVLAFLLLLSLPGRVALQVAGASLQKANFLPPSPTLSLATTKVHGKSHPKSHQEWKTRKWWIWCAGLEQPTTAGGRRWHRATGNAMKRRGYSSVVEQSTADRKVPISQLGAPYSNLNI